MLLFRALILCLFVSPLLHAEGLGFRLADDSAQFEYFKRSDISIGAGGSDLSYAFFYNEVSDVVVSAKLLAAGNIQGTSRALNAAVGGKAYLGRFDDQAADFLGGLGIGGKISYVIPSNTPMSLYFEGYFVPDIVAFSDIEGLREMQFGFEIEVAPSASAFVAFRNMEAEIENGPDDYELDDDTHFGIRFSFN